MLPKSALRFRFERSGGPGGQNVNKLATKVRLNVDLAAVREAIGAEHFKRFLTLAGDARITESGKLMLSNEQSRSQLTNRDACFAQLRQLLTDSARPPKTRRPTKPTRGSRERRIDVKKQRGQTKQMRQPPRG